MGIGVLLQKLTSKQYLTPEAWNSVEWTDAAWEGGGDFWDISAQTKVVIPVGYAGKYIITYSLYPIAYSGNRVEFALRVLKNGTEVRNQTGRGNVASQVNVAHAGYILDDFEEGDELELQVWVDGADATPDFRAIEVTANREEYHHFAVHYIENPPLEDCGVRAVRTTSFSPGGTAAVVFESVEYDTDSFWSAGDPTKITIPAGKGGTYIVTGCLDEDGTRPSVRLYKDGTLASPNFYNSSSNNGFSSPHGGIILNCVAGEYYELIANADIVAENGSPALCFQRLETIT